jgi:hypothetical protein
MRYIYTYIHNNPQAASRPIQPNPYPAGGGLPTIRYDSPSRGFATIRRLRRLLHSTNCRSAAQTNLDKTRAVCYSKTVNNHTPPAAPRGQKGGQQ